MVTVGHKQRPLRDGGGKPSPGRYHPASRKKAPLKPLGLALLAHMTTALISGPTDQLLLGRCTETPYPDHLVNNVLSTQQHHYPNIDMSIAPGQPFRLHALSTLATHANDADNNYPNTVMHGVPLGVEEYIPLSPNIWPTKDELKGQETETTDTPEPPTSHDNYPSAAEHESAIRATYAEEEPLGMTMGPFTKTEAATHCNCTPEELCAGALSGNQRADTSTN